MHLEATELSGSVGANALSNYAVSDCAPLECCIVARPYCCGVLKSRLCTHCEPCLSQIDYFLSPFARSTTPKRSEEHNKRKVKIMPTIKKNANYTMMALMTIIMIT